MESGNGAKAATDFRCLPLFCRLENGKPPVGASLPRDLLILACSRSIEAQGFTTAAQPDGASQGSSTATGVVCTNSL